MRSETQARWYALHRARRSFRRDIAQHFAKVINCADGDILFFAAGPNGERAMEMAEMLINPPLIIDPLLPNLGLPGPQHRRLP